MASDVGLDLSAPQDDFLFKLDTKFRAFVGGFGSGKTYVGALDLLLFAVKHRKFNQGYFGISYPSIRDVFFPTLDEAALSVGLRVDIKESNKEAHIFRGYRYLGTVICRSMEKPNSIVGFKIARALVDEIDTLPTDKAANAWRKIIARMRLMVPGAENTIGVTTTPEGFRFVYQKFYDEPTKSYSMVQASTHENAEFLPEDYIDSLYETYDKELCDAYIHGKFVNLTSGSVYRAFDRDTCSSTETIQPGEALYVGQDFNVEHMASVVYVQREKTWHAVAELIDLLDTPATINVINEKWPDHKIVMYPDASGNSRQSSGACSSKTDIALLTQAGYEIRAKKKNPLVRDRVLAVNKALESGRLKVNTKSCPTLAKALEQQVYDKNGEPDKKEGHDHKADAAGYPIAYEMPVERPVIKPMPLAGMH